MARPAATLAAHLGFALKHEGVHLEFLARLFEAIPATEIEAWIAAQRPLADGQGEPTGGP